MRNKKLLKYVLLFVSIAYLLLNASKYAYKLSTASRAVASPFGVGEVHCQPKGKMGWEGYIERGAFGIPTNSLTTISKELPVFYYPKHRRIIYHASLFHNFAAPLSMIAICVWLFWKWNPNRPFAAYDS